MRTVLGFLGALTLVLCNSPFDAIEMEPELPSNFMDLPIELRLTIFEHLDFKTLVRVSKTHPNNRSLIERVLRNMFWNRTIRIGRGDQEILIYYDDLMIPHIDYEYFKENLDEIVNFLQIFGDCITKIKILPDSTKAREVWDQMHVLVGEFEYIIGFTSINRSLNELNLTFSNARDVELQGIEIDPTTLYQMFPAVRSLNLRFVSMNESLCHFPQLEHLIVPNRWGSANSSLLLKQTLEVNTQLKHLSIPQCKNWQTFGLPNLEEFTMNCDCNGSKSVRDIVDFLRRPNNQLKKDNFLTLRSSVCDELAHQLKNDD